MSENCQQIWKKIIVNQLNCQNKTIAIENGIVKAVTLQGILYQNMHAS